MNALKAAYEFLKATAFCDIPLPPNVRFSTVRLKKAHGYYYFLPAARPPHEIQLDAEMTNPLLCLRVVAHEMVHMSLQYIEGNPDAEHSEKFCCVAKVVARRMGWKLKEII